MHVVKPDQLRKQLPFDPVQVGEGPEWGGLVVEEFRRHPSSDLDLPPVTCHHLALQLRDDDRLRVQRHLEGETFEGVPVAGDLTLLPAGSTGRFSSSGKTDALHVFLPESTLTRVAAEAEFSSGLALRPKVRFRDASLSATMLALLAELSEGGAGRRLYVEGLAEGLSVHLLRRHAERPTTPVDGPNGTRLSSAQLRRVIDLVMAGLGESVSLEDMAAAAAMSRFHFLRCFKATTGRTPQAFVRERRLEEAKRLMIDRPHLSLSGVAAAAGFADQSHLTRCFKRHVGQTPGRFRSVATG